MYCRAALECSVARRLPFPGFTGDTRDSLWSIDCEAELLADDGGNARWIRAFLFPSGRCRRRRGRLHRPVCCCGHWRNAVRKWPSLEAKLSAGEQVRVMAVWSSPGMKLGLSERIRRVRARIDSPDVCGIALLDRLCRTDCARSDRVRFRALGHLEVGTASQATSLVTRDKQS